MCAARQRRTAFTMFDLLVVIAILGILIALLIPAIQAAREAARRTQCANNVRMIILAVLNYESVLRTFPPAGIVAKSPPTAKKEVVLFDPMSGPQFSWVSRILPYMQEQALYEKYDFTRSIFDQKEPGALALHIPMLHCPSAGDPSLLKSPQTKDIAFAKGNYAGFTSPVYIDHATQIPGALGGFTPGSRDGQRIANFRDGTSRTMFASEVLTSSDQNDPRGAWMLPWSGSSLLSGHVLPKGGLDDLARFEKVKYEVDESTLAAAHTPNSTVADVLVACPNGVPDPHMPCVKHGTRQFDYWSAAPRGNHVTGICVALVDGSMLFVANDVDPKIWAYAICIDDAQKVSLP